MKKNLETNELISLWENQRKNYITQLYQDLSGNINSESNDRIKVTSGKIQALDEFGNTLKQFIQNKN